MFITHLVGPSIDLDQARPKDREITAGAIIGNIAICKVNRRYRRARQTAEAVIWTIVLESADAHDVIATHCSISTPRTLDC